MNDDEVYDKLVDLAKERGIDPGLLCRDLIMMHLTMHDYALRLNDRHEATGPDRQDS